MVGGYLLSDFTVNPDGTKTWTASNERNFAELSAADLAIIEQCAKDTQEFEIRAWAAKEKESEEIVRKAGTEVITLTPEAFAGFQAKMKPIYDQYGKDFADVLKAIADVK